ncbi:UNVERIFIED_CONTAM: hypothetical protein NCL1_20485 [Trichonephila clavipes]
MNRKCYVFPSLQKQNLLLLCKEHSDGHFSGHVNTHNSCIWSSEIPHEVLESQRAEYFCAIFRWKVYGPFIFGEPTVTSSAYLDALQLWLFPQLKESETG